jgi:hypothetical protein
VEYLQLKPSMHNKKLKTERRSNRENKTINRKLWEALERFRTLYLRAQNLFYFFKNVQKFAVIFMWQQPYNYNFK